MTKGYVLISRGLLKHPRFKPSGPFTQFEAWYWLIEAAAYVPREVPIINGTRGDVVTLQPGELSHSIRFLARAWSWSDKRVQRFLSALKSDQSVTTQTTTGQTVITLCNWGKYQNPFAAATTQSATGVTTQTTTKKKEIKEKKDIALSERSFSEWYSAYPKKKSREAAKRAYAKVIASGAITESNLLAKTVAFANSWAAEPQERRQFIPYPASWLNAGAYADEPDNRGGEAAPAPIDPRAFTPAQWRKRLDSHRDGGDWLELWGPQPGEPGCLVPSHLIVTPVSSSKGAA